MKTRIKNLVYSLTAVILAASCTQQGNKSENSATPLDTSTQHQKAESDAHAEQSSQGDTSQTHQHH